MIKKLLICMTLAAILSCAHVVPVVMCAEPAVVAIIENDFSSPNWEDAVGQDMLKYGPSVITCVVEQIIAAAQGKTGSDAKVEHAKAWKATHSDG